MEEPRLVRGVTNPFCYVVPNSLPLLGSRESDPAVTNEFYCDGSDAVEESKTVNIRPAHDFDWMWMEGG